MKIGAESYLYDAAGRLVRAIRAREEAYAYDAFGNLTRVTTSQNGSTSVLELPASAASNHLLVPGYTYDAAGNVTSNGSESFAYDALNMMTARGNGTEVYVYTPGEERIGIRRGERWYWSVRDGDGKVLRQYQSSASVPGEPWLWQEDYVYRDGALLGARRELAEGGTRHFHLDHLGSPRLVTGTGGLRIASHEYAPFGWETSGQNQETANGFDREEPMRFTGHERDTQDLDMMHARYYSPTVGRFLSVDPKNSAKPAMPQSWNRYAYALNNPLKYVDPDGQDVYIAVTNTVVDDTRVNSRPGGAGVNETVPAYKIVMMNEAGDVDVFAGSRDSNYEGKTMNTRGEYGSNHEAPPGSYFGKIRTDGKLGPRVELSDTKNGSSITAPDGTKRNNVQIHVGPGCSQGCVLLTGGKENRNAFINSLKYLQEQERAAGRSDQIHVVVQPRNKQECSGDRCELTPK